MNQAYYNKKIRMLQKRVHELEALLNQDPAPEPETKVPEPEPETQAPEPEIVPAPEPEKTIPGMAPKKDKAKNGKRK